MRLPVPPSAPWLLPLVTAIERGFRDLLARPVQPQSYLVADLPDATISKGVMIFVSNEAGGAVPAFSDGTNWRRVTDRAVVS